MQLLSVKEAAAKPADERMTVRMEDLVSLSDLCKELSISMAAGRNWVKSGKLLPAAKVQKSLFFTREYAAQIKADIKNGKNTALKSRRNKKHRSGNHIYHCYLSDDSINFPVVESVISYIEEKKIEVTDDLLCAILAECALQLILHKAGGETSSNCLSKYLRGEIKNTDFFLVDYFIRDGSLIAKIEDLYPDLLNKEYRYREGEDLLGLLYISLKNIASRKAAGSYYTPTSIVQKLYRRLFSMNDISKKDVFDPCCGTGNFILQLPPQIGFEHVYGNDMDSMSVQIARINFALKYHISDPDIIFSHITESDYLTFDRARRFDFIIGNPPWGYDFSESKKIDLRSKYQSAVGNTIESYDVFVEQALSNLKKGGILSFVLPQAILNVKTHTPIRRMLLNCCSIQYLEYLGNVFDQVQCPCIILQTVFTGTMFRSAGLVVFDGLREYTIRQERKTDADCFRFSTTDEEYRILQKVDGLPNKITLCGNAGFALGIVTGDNKRYVTQSKTTENEMVLRGSDLCRFRFHPSESYILFKPESFQQAAPAEYYRAPEKLLYRFICNQLVFAYDNQKTLSLNSCNILIPHVDGLCIKYILAILNSRIAQFYFKKQFHSVKVLRSHIEQIPIPLIGNVGQKRITPIVDSILETSDEDAVTALYDQLDAKIARLYGLSPEEYQIIRSSMEGENLFLI